ncbi:MAG TPA: hypothetical protein VGL42_09165 [Opitutaceae bacterium]|jgi:hypothetical protein
MSQRRFLTVAMGIALLAGCATPPPPKPAAPVARPTVVARHEWRQADGRLNVAVTVGCPSPAPLWVRVRCTFGGGPAIDPPQAQSIELGPGESATVRFAASEEAATTADISVTPSAAAR